MADVISLWQQIDGNKNTGGTWVRISASGPAAPAAYADTVDFTGQPDGNYVYDYTVTSGGATHTARVTVQYVSDCCSGVTRIITFTTQATAAPSATNRVVRFTARFPSGSLPTGTITVTNVSPGVTSGSPTNIVLTGSADFYSQDIGYGYSSAPTIQDVLEIDVSSTINGCTCDLAGYLITCALPLFVTSTFNNTLTCS